MAYPIGGEDKAQVMTAVGTNVIGTRTSKTWYFLPALLYSHNYEPESRVRQQVPGLANWELSIPLPRT
jgi:hypothetical protein